MDILCRECGNRKHFTLRREVEVEFDYVIKEWDEKHPATIKEIVICRECDRDQNEIEIAVEE